MTEDDLGSTALERVRDALEVDAEDATSGLHWSLGGIAQQAWAGAATGADGWRTWRLHVRTRAIEGFDGQPASQAVLAEVLPEPTLAGLVRNANHPSQLELASSVDVYEFNLDWAVRVLTVAARVQAAEAAALRSQTDALRKVACAPAVGVDAPAALDLLSPVVLGGWARPDDIPRWCESEIGSFFDIIKAQMPARVVPTGRGLSAIFADPDSGEKRCTLEVQANTWHPSLGDGLSIALWVHARGGALDAVAWNEDETARRHLGVGIGGWWPLPAGQLVHRSFHPRMLYQRGAAHRLLQKYALRAHELLMASTR